MKRLKPNDRKDPKNKPTDINILIISWPLILPRRSGLFDNIALAVKNSSPINV